MDKDQKRKYIQSQDELIDIENRGKITIPAPLYAEGDTVYHRNSLEPALIYARSYQLSSNQWLYQISLNPVESSQLLEFCLTKYPHG